MLDKNIKYILTGQEKYKANYSQSKTNGHLFFDVTITAVTIEELKKESEGAVNTCAEVCNDFNNKIDKHQNNNKK